ncbi:hypothetical protein ACWFOS_14790 [Gordonia terrae]
MISEEGSKVTWGSLTGAQRAGLLALASVQVSLAVSAWADLAARPAVQVRGSKRKWAWIIAINFIGPILYYTRGRQP